MRMKKLVLAAAAIATAASIGLSASPADASTGTNVVQGQIDPPVSVLLTDGYTVSDQSLCRVYLLRTWDTPNDYAAVKVVNAATSTYTADGWDVGCFGSLERSTNGGASWDVISGIHDESTASRCRRITTGRPGYLAGRAATSTCITTTDSATTVRPTAPPTAPVPGKSASAPHLQVLAAGVWPRAHPRRTARDP